MAGEAPTGYASNLHGSFLGLPCTDLRPVTNVTLHGSILGIQFPAYERLSGEGRHSGTPRGLMETRQPRCI